MKRFSGETGHDRARSSSFSVLREHLPRDQQASPHTCDAYAYGFQLLVSFADSGCARGRRASTLKDDVPLILAFLEHIERDRGNTARSRNARLAAVRSFFRFLEYRVPACLDQALRVRAIPMKKTDEALVRSLTRLEIRALLDAPTHALYRACGIVPCCILPSPRGCASPSWSGFRSIDWTPDRPQRPRYGQGAARARPAAVEGDYGRPQGMARRPPARR